MIDNTSSKKENRGLGAMNMESPVCICGFHSSKANLNQRHNMWKNDCCKNVGKNVERMGRDFWQGNKGTQAGHALAQVLKKSLQMDFEN